MDQSKLLLTCIILAKTKATVETILVPQNQRKKEITLQFYGLVTRWNLYERKEKKNKQNKPHTQGIQQDIKYYLNFLQYILSISGNILLHGYFKSIDP